MLVRSASTPVLGALHASSAGGGHSPAVHFAESSPTLAYHPPAISCSLSAAGGSSSDHERSRGGAGRGLRRACSDGNLSALGARADDHHHHLPPRSRPALETIQSFTARDGSRDEEEEDDDEEQETSFGAFGGFGAGTGSTYAQEGAPAVPGQGARDRPAGLGPAERRRRRHRRRGRGRRLPGGLRRRWRGPLRHRDPLQETHRGRPLQRPLPQELRAVPLPGERGSAEGRGVLLPRDTGGPKRRRAALGVRQDGVRPAPRRGARLQLLRPGGQGLPAQQPRPRRASRLPVGHRRWRRARRRWHEHELHRVPRCSPVHGFRDELNLAIAVSPSRS